MNEWIQADPLGHTQRQPTAQTRSPMEVLCLHPAFCKPTPSHPSQSPCPGPHRIVELSHQLRVLEIALAPIHLRALVGKDAGHLCSALVLMHVPRAWQRRARRVSEPRSAQPRRGGDRTAQGPRSRLRGKTCWAAPLLHQVAWQMCTVGHRGRPGQRRRGWCCLGDNEKGGGHPSWHLRGKT